MINSGVLFQIRLFPSESRYDGEFHRKVAPGRFSVMCHGVISADGPVSFAVVTGSINRFTYTVLLAKTVMPKIRERRKKKKRTIWMHDNAPCHKARLVQAYLKKCKVSVMKWPPLSPDMNPIENVWNIMWQYIGKRSPTTKKELESLMYKAWEKLVTPQLCRKLYDTMQRRVLDLLLNDGLRTKW